MQEGPINALKHAVASTANMTVRYALDELQIEVRDNGVGSSTTDGGFGGDQVAVVAGVLVYRFLTIVPTLLIGLLAGVTWKRYRPECESPTWPPGTSM